MRHAKIRTFYTPLMAPATLTGSYSISPNKPTMLMQHMENAGRGHLLEIDGTFKPFGRQDFLVAHKPRYVDAFLEGDGPDASSNGIPWSNAFAETVGYTNASLYEAIKYANAHPDTVTFSPTSGFHHAQPTSGMGFCTFSGQVIASVKLYREQGLRGAYLDLDGHFGNSIEDSRTYVKDLDQAVEVGNNINIHRWGQDYVDRLGEKLVELRNKIVRGEVDYVVWCHGADSHNWDDLGGGCNTSEWLACSRIFFEWVKKMDEELGRPLPVTIALFGGYRKDHYDSVLELHTADICTCAYTLLDRPDAAYRPTLVPKPGVFVSEGDKPFIK